MRTLVLGIGNPILTDDAVGLRIAQEIKQKACQKVDVAETTEGGLSLLEIIGDHDRLIILDSVITGKNQPGEINRLIPGKTYTPTGFTTTHALSIDTAFNLLEQTGHKIPHQIIIYAIEVKDNTTFSEKCTPDIEKAIPEIARQIIGKEHL